MNHTNKDIASNRLSSSPLSVSIRRDSPVTSLPATTRHRNLSVLSVSAFPKTYFLQPGQFARARTPMKRRDAEDTELLQAQDVILQQL